jgi:type I restriction enzyme S subunit
MVTAVDVTIARPDAGQVKPMFLLYSINSSAHLSRCAAKATGATRPRIARRVMGALPLILPPAELQHEFSEFALANNELKERLTRQSAALMKARDLLLPRLMDGRLSV